MGQPKISVALGGAGENLGRFRWGRFSARRRFGWGPPFRPFGWGRNKKIRFRWGRQNNCACGARSAGRDQGCVGWSSARTLRGHVLLCSRWTCSRVTDARTTPRERYARSPFPADPFISWDQLLVPRRATCATRLLPSHSLGQTKSSSAWPHGRKHCFSGCIASLSTCVAVLRRAGAGKTVAFIVYYGSVQMVSGDLPCMPSGAAGGIECGGQLCALQRCSTLQGNI